MADILYPCGYGRMLLNADDMKARYGMKMHPEFSRRFFAWLASRNGSIGIGSSWRRCPDPVSAASRACHSFHQSQRFASGIVGCSAVDLVARNGTNVHRAPHWNEVPKQGSGHPDIARYGLHVNVPNESWHIQPVELDGWQTWSRSGRRDPRQGYPLPSDSKPDGWPPVDFNQAVYGLWPLAKKPILRINSQGDPVRYCQSVIYFKAGGNIAVDGDYGTQTMSRVKDLQSFMKMAVDGVVGPATWNVIDMLANTY